MTTFDRADRSLLGRWWWTVDRWSLAALAGLIGFGALLALAASPPVAERLNLDSFYFARRQIAQLPLAIVIMLGVSLLSPVGVRRFALLLLAVSLALLAATFFVGTEIKGARRWLDVGGLSLQPSELIKPAIAVVTAWLLAAHRGGDMPAGRPVAFALFAVVVGLLVLQPDIGMTFVVAAAWVAQVFVAGLSLHWVAAIGLASLGAMAAAYVTLPHVTSRVDRFLDPAAGDSFQVNTSLESFARGGMFGRGPGEGTIKSVLPDAHADFVFAVAGEEFGLIVCLIIVALFTAVVLRGFARALNTGSLYIMLGAGGLAVQFGLQAVVNMGSALRLMPAKGMTLPFISYGGSSLLSVALTVGMLLALTRRRIEGGAA